MTSARKFRMVRLGPGDYLLLGNDERTLWRIHSYVENGSLVEYPAGDRSYEKGRKIIGTFWACSCYREPFDERFLDLFAQELAEEGSLGWDRWSEQTSLHRTRKEAVESIIDYTPSFLRPR